MNKKDISELKRRLTKDGCTFSRMCGCYVDGEKNMVVNLNETFLNLEDEEFYKYLEIAKKTMSGTIGNNLLELSFPLEEESAGGKQQFLMGLKASELKNEDLLTRFYELVIDNYDYVGNFLILLFHDTYDVMTKTSDNNKLDESEEIYDYLICAICPVTLTKPGLGYREDENRIGPRIRDWVVGAPDSGFIFPAFTDRSTDIHSLMFYTKNTKEPHKEFMAEGLSCIPLRTATEQKVTFESIVKSAVYDDEEKGDELFYEIQDSLNNLIIANTPVEEDEEVEAEPVILTNNVIKTIIEENEIPEETAVIIEESYTAEFGETPPVAENLLDKKTLVAGEHKKKEKELVKKVAELTKELEETRLLTDEELTNYDIIVKVKPEKVTQIKSQVIDGQKCIIIPLSEDEQANVNGVDTIL